MKKEMKLERKKKKTKREKRKGENRTLSGLRFLIFVFRFGVLVGYLLRVVARL